MRLRHLEPRSHAAEDLCEAVARARGCSTAAEVSEFLDPAPPLANPIDSLGDYGAARERIRRALHDRERVTIFGDYDCDGITALVQAHDFFRAAGHDALSWFVPDRMIHDYGLSRAAAEECVTRLRPQLLICVDCGSPAHGPIAWLRERGVDCIVVDHHAVAGGNPPLPAVAHLNPKAWDLGALPAGTASGLLDMSAAGLAFLLFDRLARDLGVGARDRARACLLAGLGTVVDVMPLRRMNRALVKAALRLANRDSSLRRVPGLVALKEVTRTGRVDARTFGFRWGPRLNANGRLEEASQPIRLLLAEDLATARPLAAACHETNAERRDLQQQAEQKASRMAEEHLSAHPQEKVLVLCDGEWHPGVVGIVAGRLRERFQRPSIVCGWHEDGYWKGSGRSPEAFDLGAAVQAARDAGLLLGGGGHRAAAGVRIAPEKIGDLRLWLHSRCEQSLEDFAPVHEVLAAADALDESDSRALVRGWCEILRRLEPFGSGNPAPALLLRNAAMCWGPKDKTRREGGERWAVGAGFSWRGRGYLFADWTDPARADGVWAGGGRYDLVLAPVESEGTDRATGQPVTWYDWRVIDCERAG